MASDILGIFLFPNCSGFQSFSFAWQTPEFLDTRFLLGLLRRYKPSASAMSLFPFCYQTNKKKKSEIETKRISFCILFLVVFEIKRHIQKNTCFLVVYSNAVIAKRKRKEEEETRFFVLFFHHLVSELSFDWLCMKWWKKKLYESWTALNWHTSKWTLYKILCRYVKVKHWFIHFVKTHFLFSLFLCLWMLHIYNI